MNQNSKRMKECYKDIDKEKMYQDLDLIVKSYNGQWSPEAEQFLLKNAPRL